MFFLFLLFIKTLKDLIKYITKRSGNNTRYNNHSDNNNNKRTRKMKKSVSFADEDNRPLEIIIAPSLL